MIQIFHHKLNKTLKFQQDWPSCWKRWTCVYMQGGWLADLKEMAWRHWSSEPIFVSKCCLIYKEAEQTKGLCLLEPVPPPPLPHCSLPNTKACPLKDLPVVIGKVGSGSRRTILVDSLSCRPASSGMCGVIVGNKEQSLFRKMPGNL